MAREEFRTREMVEDVRVFEALLAQGDIEQAAALAPRLVSSEAARRYCERDPMEFRIRLIEAAFARGDDRWRIYAKNAITTAVTCVHLPSALETEQPEPIEVAIWRLEDLAFLLDVLIDTADVELIKLGTKALIATNEQTTDDLDSRFLVMPRLYLAALRTGDTERAQSHLAKMVELAEGLREIVAEDLERFRQGKGRHLLLSNKMAADRVAASGEQLQRFIDVAKTNGQDEEAALFQTLKNEAAAHRAETDPMPRKPDGSPDYEEFYRLPWEDPGEEKPSS